MLAVSAALVAMMARAALVAMTVLASSVAKHLEHSHLRSQSWETEHAEIADKAFISHHSMAQLAPAAQNSTEQKDAKPTPPPAPGLGDLPGTPELKGMPLKAREQGYHGEHVQHEDQSTMTSDWGAEYGEEHKWWETTKPSLKLKSAARRSDFCLALLSPLLLLHLHWH